MTKSSATSYRMQTNESFLDNADKKYILRVRDLAEENRPREKMVERGSSALSSPELLAVVLNTGTIKEEVMTMAHRLLQEYGSKMIIFSANPKALAEEFKIPLTKACQVAACFELGRRFFQQPHGGQVVVRTAKQAYNYFKDMGGLSKEYLRGIYLNSRYQVIHDEVISVGSLTANIVHPREVFKPAITHSAAAVIIAHNHPSGIVKPTISDFEITKQLTAAGKIIGIDLLDHIIIGKNSFVSIPLE